jgi:hypothetical protein
MTEDAVDFARKQKLKKIMMSTKQWLTKQTLCKATQTIKQFTIFYSARKYVIKIEWSRDFPKEQQQACSITCADIARKLLLRIIS